MASTALGDVYKPQAVSAYMAAALPTVLPLVASGAAIVDPTGLAEEGGDTVQIRKFVEDTTAAVLDDGTAATIYNVTSYRQIGAVSRRRRYRGVDIGLKAALGRGDEEAVNMEIARQAVYYWPKTIETSAINVMKGLFDDTSGCLKTTHRNKVGAATGTKVYATFNAVVDTAVKGGDNYTDIALMIVHSKVWGDLEKENGSKACYQYITDGSGGQSRVPFYGRMRVIVSDLWAPTSDTNPLYSTLLVKPGAITLMFQQALKVGMQFNASTNRDELVESYAYIPHVNGTTWGGTAASAAGPTDAEWATAGNWSKPSGVNDKEIGVYQLLSN